MLHRLIYYGDQKLSPLLLERMKSINNYLFMITQVETKDFILQSLLNENLDFVKFISKILDTIGDLIR